MPRPTTSRAASALAPPAPLGRRCRPREHGQSSAPTSPAEPAAVRTPSAGSGGAVGPWGCDPPPAPALGTLRLHGSTCAKHYRRIAESMVRAGNAAQARGKKGLQRGLQAPASPMALLLGGKRRCTSKYLKVLPCPGRALLRRGWLRFQSRGALAVAAHRFLPGSRLNLGTCNDVRPGHVSVPGRRAGGRDGQGAKTQRKPRGFAAPEKSQENFHAWQRDSKVKSERAG